LRTDPVGDAVPGLERRVEIGGREGLLPEAGIGVEQVVAALHAQLDDAAAETRHESERQGRVRETEHRGHGPALARRGRPDREAEGQAEKRPQRPWWR